MRAICVVGTRPNFMKVKPVMEALEAGGVEVLLVHTGQHYDAGMSAAFFADLDMRAPDFALGVGSGPHGAQTGAVMAAFEPVVERTSPDVVVVVGDVNSTLGAALVAAKSGALVAHVEAGLRSRDWTMPEEVNRVVVDAVSDYLFAPSEEAVANLGAEGHHPDQVHLVGNVMVDTLLGHLDAARKRPLLADLGLAPGAYGVVTLHRPATVDDPATLGAVLGALAEVAEHCPLVWPLHPRVQPVGWDPPPGLQVTRPLGYLDFVALEASARLVLTDSGGIQEETTVLGVPCLTLRDNTERPITVSQGTNLVVGRDPGRIVAEARRVLLEGVPARRPPLWDGRAGERIAGVIAAGGPPRGHLRPTDLRVR